MNIRDRIIGTVDVEWGKLKDLQPDDLKINTNFEHLKKSIEDNGFAVPFAVWKKGKSYYCMDGHNRKNALKSIVEDGNTVPDKLTAIEIEASNREEAINILLTVYNQKPNAIDNGILEEWLESEEISIQNLSSLDIIDTDEEDYFDVNGEDEEEEECPAKHNASDDGYSAISFVVEYGLKKDFMNLIKEIVESESYETQEQAIKYIVENLKL